MTLFFAESKKKSFLLLILVSLLMLSACQKEVEISEEEKEYNKKYVDFVSTLEVDEDNISSYIEELSSAKYEGRKTGTYGEAESSLYLATYLQSLEIPPYHDNLYFDSFVDSNHGIEGENVIGILKNPDRHKYIIISANYDNLGREKGGKEGFFPGANQNASGVSSVMEMARVFTEKFDTLEYNIVFAFWSGHEQNLSGSKAFVESLNEIEKENILFVVNLDTIGTFGSKEYIIWRENDLPEYVIEELLNWKDLSMSLSARGSDNSDHYYFGIENIPALTIRSEDWQSGSGTTRDTIYGVNTENVKRLTQNLVNFIYHLEGEKDA